MSGVDGVSVSQESQKMEASSRAPRRGLEALSLCLDRQPEKSGVRSPVKTTSYVKSKTSL